MELILRGGTVITMDDVRSVASSMLVRNGRIGAVGDDNSVERAAAPDAHVVRIQGKTIVPGMIDAHCHISIIGYLLTAADCSQPSAPDIPTIQQRLREKAATERKGSWVRGSGYVEYKLKERRHPNRWDLDKAVENRPCILYHTSFHACVLNTAALRQTGYTDESPDPVGGMLGRDDQGRLDGVIFEAPMFTVLQQDMRRSIADMSEAERVAMVKRACDYFATLGVTACEDADLLKEAYDAFAEAERHNALPLRIAAIFDHGEFDWLLDAGMAVGGSERLRVAGIKIFADGGMSSRTAAIDATYPVPPYGSGLLFHEREELADMMRRFDHAGFQIAVHAQGDRAIRNVLDAYEEVLRASPGNPRRHRIEHGGAMYPELIEKDVSLGIHVATQPGFLSILGDGFIDAFGEEKANLLYPLRQLRCGGVAVAGSSDAPVITASPLVGIRDAVLRRTASGRTIGETEGLTASEALELYTRGSAFVTSFEHASGSIEPGKLADFVVLEENPLEVPVETIPSIEVLATVVGGRAAYQKREIIPEETKAERTRTWFGSDKRQSKWRGRPSA